MSDTIRDRIAAAIAGVDDWGGVTDPTILADAVIGELGLVVEDGIRPGFALKRSPRRYRYVTEWITERKGRR